MAYSSAELSTSELAWGAAGKPIISSNALYNTSTAAGWDAGTTAGTVASATEDAAGFEAERLFDGLPGLVSKPDAASATHTIVFDRSASPITFDWFGILNHNLDTLVCTALVLQIADDAAFTTNLITLSTTNIATSLSSDRRFADLTLFHTGSVPLRYTAVPYIRIAITCTSGTPQIGQVVLGRGRQQQFAPNQPWDPTNQNSSMDDFESQSGVITRVSRYKARREIDALFRHDTTAEQSDIKSWWQDIEGGEQPLFYIDSPASSPMDFWMMFMRTPSLLYPYTLYATRDFRLDAIEQGPNFFSLE